MSKKRTIILVLVLLPLALGAGLVARLANGPQSAELASAQITERAEVSLPDVNPIHVATGSDFLHVPAEGTPQSGAIEAPVSEESMHMLAKLETPLELESALEGADVDATLVAHVGEQSSQRPFYSGFGGGGSVLGGGGFASRSGGGGVGGGGGATPSTGSDSDSESDASTLVPPRSNEEEDALPPAEDTRTGSSTENSGSGPEVPPSKEDPKPRGPQQQNPPDVYNPIDTDFYIPPGDASRPQVSVPEPGTLGLLGLGLLGCALARRKRSD